MTGKKAKAISPQRTYRCNDPYCTEFGSVNPGGTCSGHRETTDPFEMLEKLRNRKHKLEQQIDALIDGYYEPIDFDNIGGKLYG